MVKERNPSRTSSGQFLSPQKAQQRQPLANISAKMQSPSPNQSSQTDTDLPLKQATQPKFGEVSLGRNILKKDTNIFIPKTKPIHKPSPSEARPVFTHGAPPEFSSAQSTVPRAFTLPARASESQAHAPSALSTGERYPNQPYQRSFEVPRPYNAPPITTRPLSKPTFSSLGPNTSYQPHAPARPFVDLTNDADDHDNDGDAFDPDAAIRAESHGFGAPDPYMYVDAAQANDNIKNLLEGAFDDDDDKSRTRIRKRAKRAAQEGNRKEAKTLADKLALLSVKPEAESGTKEEEEEGEEDGTVEGLAIKLLPHQVEGVAWMIDKEIGQRKKNGVLPYGGILADDMGLGKTVQSVALLLTNPRPELDAKPEHPKQKLPGQDIGKGTLVVAPLALIKQWEDEIKTKVSRSHALRVLVHHGPSRTKSALELKKYDVVITTYQTLTSEHAGSNMKVAGGARTGCFGVNWYRIMLDEAHSIKNRSAKSTLACCALNSWYRWCLTGTPMQNNLDELQSLIKFLRIKPYAELSNWKSAITGPMKNGRGGLAIKRLQLFLKAFMKRRTKDILKKEGALNFGGNEKKEGESKNAGMQIVKREVLTVECEFDESELEFYNRLQERADKRLQEMAKEGEKADYMGALVLLLRLRQVCDHPYLIEGAMNKDKDAMTTSTSIAANGLAPRNMNMDGESEMDDLTTLLGGVSVTSKICDVCRIRLSTAEIREGVVRCTDCDSDIMFLKNKKDSKSSTKLGRTKGGQPPQRRNMHRLPDDSDDEGEGEWIGDGPERREDLGKAGGSDDEDAEGGGETLGSIDSVRSDDADESDDDSPPRATNRRHITKTKSKDLEQDETDDEDEDSASDDSSSNGSNKSNILSGFQRGADSKHQPSTKIRHLLRILHTETPQHKTIVFSQFTTMLDLIEPHLRGRGFHYVRYDGSMRNDAREAALHSLRTDPQTRVLLCSLKCGSLGLNLTAASRVVIVEPFWNPFVEEQAIDRVHRLNQTVDVKVYRLTVRDTVEERILALQERKRELAKAAIEDGKDVGKLSMNDILSLFKHGAEHGAQDDDDRAMWTKFGGDKRLIDGAGDGLSVARDDVGIIGSKSAKARKVKPHREHEVFGRRW